MSATTIDRTGTRDGLLRLTMRADAVISSDGNMRTVYAAQSLTTAYAHLTVVCDGQAWQTVGAGRPAGSAVFSSQLRVQRICGRDRTKINSV